MLALYHGRVLIPKAARREILEILHMNHCGEGKSLANARQLYYWDGMAKDIKNDISKCRECLLLKPSKPMESLVQSTASRPFEAVSVDLGMLKGVNYLVLVDRFTGWPMVRRLAKLNARNPLSPHCWNQPDTE